MINVKIITSTYISAESHYLKPDLGIDKIINKGVWIKDPKNKYFESNAGEFVFRENSLDVDNILQNNFDTFGDNGVQDSQGIFEYVQRSKRASNCKYIYKIIRCF